MSYSLGLRAVDINPKTSLGKVKIVVPSGLPQNFKYRLWIDPQYGTDITNVLPDQSYELDEQTICLGIATNNGLWSNERRTYDHISSKSLFCGYQIKKGTEVVINLTSFKLLSRPTYKIDIGPMMRFRATIDADLSQKSDNPLGLNSSVLEWHNFDSIYLVPQGNIQVNYSLGLGLENILPSKKVSLRNNGQIVDITPPDMRKAYRIKINNTPALDLRNNPSVSSPNIAFFGYENIEAGPLGGKTYIPSEVHVYKNGIDMNIATKKVLQIPLEKAVTLEYLAFPREIRSANYILYINGFSEIFGDNEFQKSITAVDVKNFNNGTVPGFYTITRLASKASEFNQKVRGYYNDGSNYINVDLKLIPTNSSIMLLDGFKYSLDAYIKAANGAIVKEETIELDL